MVRACKHILVAISFVFLFSSLLGKHIGKLDSVNLISTYQNADTVYFKINSTLSSLLLFKSNDFNITDSTITIDLFYCLSGLFIMDYYSDTMAVYPVPNGSYSLQCNLMIVKRYIDTTCTNFTAADSILQLLVKDSNGVHFDSWVQVRDIDASKNTTIYPNPVTDRLSILINSNAPLPVEMELMDVQGRIVQRTTLNTCRATIDIGEKRKGFYLMRLVNEQFIDHWKILKL